MLDAVVPAAFENVQGAGDVGADVDVRVLRGVAHARLGGEVDDAPRLVFFEHGFDKRPVGQVAGDVGVVVVVPEVVQAGRFQFGVVVGVQVV